MVYGCYWYSNVGFGCFADGFNFTANEAYKKRRAAVDFGAFFGSFVGSIHGVNIELGDGKSVVIMAFGSFAFVIAIAGAFLLYIGISNEKKIEIIAMSSLPCFVLACVLFVSCVMYEYNRNNFTAQEVFILANINEKNKNYVRAIQLYKHAKYGVGRNSAVCDGIDRLIDRCKEKIQNFD